MGQSYFFDKQQSKTARRKKEHCLLPPAEPYPWLLYFNGNNQTFCSISDATKTYPRSIPELQGTSLWAIQHGWCLLGRCFGELFLWNPSSLDKISLPILKYNEKARIRQCIFSCSPSATDQVCFIFLFPYMSRNETLTNVLFYCQLGDKQWTEVDYGEDLMRASGVERELRPSNIYLWNPVYCNGRLYAESWFPSRLLLVIDRLESHGLQISSTHVYSPNPFPDLFDYVVQNLESNNELFHIQISLDEDSIFGIAVYKLDFSQMVWEKVKSIEDRVFFLSYNDLPFACQATNPAERGLIYFTSKHNKVVHIYNIEDNSLRIGQAFSNLPQKRDRSLWFMPNLRMALAPQEERGKTQTSATIHNSYETQERTTNSCAFPFEIIEVVAEYLDAFDYLHFRAINSIFRLKAPPLQWRSPFHFSMSSSFDDLSPSPLFVFFEEENVLTCVHPKHGIKYKYSMNLPQDIQGGCEIIYSKDGWLLLAVNTFSNMFFNPFTKQVNHLADGPLVQGRRVRNIPCVGFSHPPTSSECVVVELHHRPTITVYITALVKENWEGTIFGDTDFSLTNSSPCFHNGAFYYLSDKGKLAISKVVGEEDIVWEQYEKPEAPCDHYYKCFLVECNDNLLSVFEGYFGKWVQVFKLDESKREWIQVENLENHMLFVGHTSFSTMAKIPGMENKIYFPKFYDQNIVFYSLDTNNYHTFASSKIVDYHCMDEKPNSTWIQPRLR